MNNARKIKAGNCRKVDLMKRFDKVTTSVIFQRRDDEAPSSNIEITNPYSIEHFKQPCVLIQHTIAACQCHLSQYLWQISRKTFNCLCHKFGIVQGTETIPFNNNSKIMKQFCELGRFVYNSKCD